MKKLFYRIVFFLFLVLGPWSIVLGLFLFPGPAFANNLIPELSRKGIQKWSPPAISKLKLPNGLQIYLMEDHQLPLFQMQLFVKSGDSFEPASLTGLSDIMTDLLVTGGTEEKPPEVFDTWLDNRAIHLSAESGRELSQITLSCLSNERKEAIQILGELLTHPRWDPERFKLAISRYKEDLRRDEDEPETIAVRAFRKGIYGENHPWARVATEKSLNRMQIKDIQKFYQEYFHPNRMLLAVAGDFSKGEVQKLIGAWAASMPSVEVVTPHFEVLPFHNKPMEKKIHKKLTQSFIEVGHLGLQRFDKEEYAYSLLQYILGGEAFTSRLGSDIRSERGLAYGVYTDWDSNPVRGTFMIHVQTRADAEGAVLERIRYHLNEISQKGDVTEEELQAAKDAMLNKYIFWFDSPFKWVFMKARYDMLGFPDDYLLTYPQKMRSVTPAEVNAVAKEYIQPEGVTVVIVGP